ncbi:MAG: TIGR02452 family protein [Lachnospiraceae bacterium]|nr:TIGR02452 family protein [Lachnospiraceae bacterium]
MGREQNAEIFRDTEKFCKKNEKIKSSTSKAATAQNLILEADQVHAGSLDRFSGRAKIVVSKKRSYEAAAAYKGMKTAVHNFASASNPGGGVTRGASAQEECLCRCSNLYFCLNTPAMWEGFYMPHRNAHDPLHNDDIIYTPGITVFKSDTAAPALMPEDRWYDVDVITCAAPNLREKPSNACNSGDGTGSVSITDNELRAIHVKRLKRILDVAVAEGDEVIILGAFGCGAFMNNPSVVADAAEDVIKDYMNAFKVIEFAIYCSPRDERNYEIFKRVLS